MGSRSHSNLFDKKGMGVGKWDRVYAEAAAAASGKVFRSTDQTLKRSSIQEKVINTGGKVVNR